MRGNGVRVTLLSRSPTITSLARTPLVSRSGTLARLAGSVLSASVFGFGWGAEELTCVWYLVCAWYLQSINSIHTCELERESSVGTLNEAVVVVTGASRGLGRAIAEELASGGAKVVVNYSTSKEPAEEIVSQISESGGEAIAVQADVSDAEQAQKLIDQAIEKFNRVDVLVNNAGINIDRTLKKLSVEDWDKVIQVDLNSAFYTVHAVLPHMTDQGGGKIINMSSFVGEAGNIGQANYSAAKAGLLGFTKTAAQELARSGITVNAICPGFIETDMVANIPEEAQQKLLKQVPLGRFGKPEEVARAVRYLIEDGDYITGQSIDINGGIYIRT